MYKMQKINCSGGTLICNWKGKGVKMVVATGEGKGENGTVATAGKPATMQKHIKRMKKDLIHQIQNRFD